MVYRFIAIAIVLCVSSEIEPKLIAPKMKNKTF